MLKGEFPISDTAAKMVEARFNPHERSDVDTLKQLGAAFITQCELIRSKNEGAECDRRASIAITHIETGTMYAVKALFARVEA